MKKASLLLCVFILASALPVYADDRGMTFTPYIGAYWGNADFEEASSGSNLDIEQDATFGMILGWERDEGQLELSYSRQSTEFDGSGSVASAVLVDVDVQNLLFAGRLTLDPGSGAYLSFLLGLTELDIDAPELDSDILPSLGFAGGIERPINDKLGFRLGLRAIASILDTDSDGLCDSSRNCPILIESGTLVQIELIAGIAFRF